MRIVVIGGYCRSLVNFRGPLLSVLRNQGHEVIGAAPEDDAVTEVRQHLYTRGIEFEPVALARGGLNPVRELKLVLS